MTAASPPLAWSRRLAAGLLLAVSCLSGLAVVLLRDLSALGGDTLALGAGFLALLGFPVSGLLVLFLSFPGRFPGHRTGSWLGWTSLLLALGALGCAAIPRLLAASWLLLLVASLPFACGGFVVTLLLGRFAERAASVYGWGLVGAGLGVAGSALLLGWSDPLVTCAVLAVSAALAALLFAAGVEARRARGAALGGLVLAAALAASGPAGWRSEPGAGRGPLPRGASSPSRANIPSGARAELLSLPALLRARPETLSVGAGGVGIGEDSRALLSRDPARYDVIQAAEFSDAISVPGGPIPFTGDPRYTLEAIHGYLDHLRPEGILALSRSMPGPQLLRLGGTARAALEERGAAAPDAHVFAAAAGGFATVLVKATPFTSEETAALEARSRERGFVVFSSPARRGDGPRLAAVGPPLTDDRPFLAALPPSTELLRFGPAGRQANPEEGVVPTPRTPLAMIVALVLCCLALPALVRGRVPRLIVPRAALLVAYFAALGLGFVAVEVSMIKRCLLLLGRPALITGGALPAFLLAAGFGSWRARRLAGQRATLRRRCAALVIVLLLAAVLVPALVDLALAAPFWIRLTAAIVVVAPLGYLLGQPFPLGAALVRERDARLLPWAVSVNGAFFVAGAAALLLLAVRFGGTATALVGPASYLIAAALAEEL